MDKRGLLRSGVVSRFRPGVLTLLALVVFLSGCAANGTAVKKDYFDVLNRWTRGKKVYEGLESRLYIYATYKSDEFRDAYIDRYAWSYQIEDDYKAAMLEREKEQSEKYNEFFVSAYTPDESWNDFEQTDSVWKLYLEDGSGARMTPVSITKTDRSDPLLREFFPYMDLWSSGYIVRFPKYTESGAEPVPGPGTKALKLTVTGVLGKGELEWRLKE